MHFFVFVLFSCFVWCFRRWQCSSFHQTAATFALGGHPLYVESVHQFPCDFCFVLDPSASSFLHMLTKLHCSGCGNIWTFVFAVILINSSISLHLTLAFVLMLADSAACFILMLCCHGQCLLTLCPDCWSCCHHMVFFIFIFCNLLYDCSLFWVTHLEIPAWSPCISIKFCSWEWQLWGFILWLLLLFDVFVKPWCKPYTVKEMSQPITETREAKAFVW